ncbi:hypothetical protein [Sphingomonas psychrotolerans]|uniref:Lipid/polyisoprenoid-binding YceI-like domain-containing protein n=1 Tax=Sphingomonas psychrotolerans TaxID=1327635 RepID=A0A2K8MGS7_9SPHN|nr:hypothetical protein [Sphingomonas psychrotolerans]ATY33088.1 hypothetical protein CVN68_14875 [Sphingomonas psychrotolerans]
MRGTLLVICGLAIVAINGTAQAQAKDFRCRAGAGRSEAVTLGKVAARGRIAGDISVSSMSMHVKYATFGGANFAAADGSWTARLDVIGSARSQRNLLLARLRVLRSGKEQTYSLGDLGIGVTVPFSLTVADGKVTATLGKKTAEADIPVAPSTAKIACSTGEVTFADVELTQ